jgi:hypothetical protein
MTSSPNPAPDSSPDSGPPPFPQQARATLAAAAGQPEKRCPKCGLRWFYSRDGGGDLSCVYCGRVEYKRPVVDATDPGPGSRR